MGEILLGQWKTRIGVERKTAVDPRVQSHIGKVISYRHKRVLCQLPSRSWLSSTRTIHVLHHHHLAPSSSLPLMPRPPPPCYLLRCPEAPSHRRHTGTRPFHTNLYAAMVAALATLCKSPGHSISTRPLSPPPFFPRYLFPLFFSLASLSLFLFVCVSNRAVHVHLHAMQ